VTQNALVTVVCQAARTCSAIELRRTLQYLPVKQGVALTGRNTTGLPSRAALVSYVAYATPWSVTDDDRRHRAKQYWPPKLCVGGPVTTHRLVTTSSQF